MKRNLLIILSIIVVLVLAYYIKSDVLRIDIFEGRHMLFWRE